MQTNIRQALLCLVLLCIYGCGGSDGADKSIAKLNDSQQIKSLVTEFADTASPASMKKYFGPGQKIGKDEFKKFLSMTYKLNGTPTITGDTATGQVNMVGVNDGKDLGTKDWSFIKEGPSWKIKEAQVP